MEATASSQGGTYDKEGALRNLGGDLELLKEVARMFVTDWPQQRSAIQNALAQADAPSLRVSVHSVKGAVSNFGAHHAAALALDMEAACKRGDLSRAPEQAEALFREVDLVAAALEREFG